MRKPTKQEIELLMVLQDVLEWAKGNRGSKEVNPYCVPEIKNALRLIAKIQGIDNYMDARTA